jgi:glutaredoxin-related protein
VIEAMGAGRRAAAAMKAYLRIRDDHPRYDEGEGKRFGIALPEGNFARVKAA